MKSNSAQARRSGVILAVALLAGILGFLFWRSFLPGYVHFSNDGPLGQQKPAWVQIPEAITGAWDDINYIGWNGGSVWPGVTTLLRFLTLNPEGFSKFFAPMSLFILGFGAWTCFTQLKLARPAALVGAIGVTLNSAYFSTACWGVASQQIAAGFDFMALALVVSITPTMPPLIRWTRIILAGLAVGMNIMEAADIGALYSMMIAAFVCYHAWVATEGSTTLRISRGVARVILIALSAAFIAALALSNLIGTQIQGVAGTQQDEATKQAHWDFATQWSFPKRETLALVIPGLYGFRMDMQGGGNYWGVGGRDPNWWRYIENGRQGQAPQGYIRQAGGGCYMGVTAVLLAFWAAFQSFRKNPKRGAADILSAEQTHRPSATDRMSAAQLSRPSPADRMSTARWSVFTGVERKLIWFWAGVIVISLPLAYGRYAPFFQFVYALPYASTVRNPGKFLATFTFAMTILAAFGIHGLCRGYLETPFAGATDWGTRLKNWWAKASVFDRRWTIGCLATLALSLVGWLVYWRSQPALEQYLQTVQFDETQAPGIAEFSIRQVGWFILFLSLGIGLITLIVSGAFAGKRAKTGAILLGLLVVADLGRADLPWVKHIYYPEKYADNPILEKLRDKPYEHRVAILPFRAPQDYNLIDPIYRIEWAQHHFPYYNIQSLDVIQMPRMPEDLAAFETALASDGTTNTDYRVCRRWELTNTRYLLGAAGFLDVLNQRLDFPKQRFHIATTFDIVPKPGIARPTRYEELTAVLNPNGAGKYALFEFTGALPRAKLYASWQVNTNDQAVLKTMASETFDPAKTVLVDAGMTQTNQNGTNNNSGTVDFESYAPKHIVLKVQSDAPSVLLLNDKYDPNWQVWVDGKQAELLRCNFLMRGVYLPTKGEHKVEFIFKPDIRTLYVSLAAIVIGIGLLGVVAFHAKSPRRGK